MRVAAQPIDGDKVRRDFGTNTTQVKVATATYSRESMERALIGERKLVLWIEWGRTSDVFRTILAMIAIMNEPKSVEIERRTKSEKAISESESEKILSL